MPTSHSNSRALPTPRELFLSRRSISTFSRRYGLAEPQLLPVGFGTCRANVAWRSAVSINEAQAATSQRGDLGLCQTQDAIAHKSRWADPRKRGTLATPYHWRRAAVCHRPTFLLPSPERSRVSLAWTHPRTSAVVLTIKPTYGCNALTLYTNCVKCQT